MSNVHEVYPLELLKKCRRDLQNAKNSTADQLILERIDFVEKGLNYTELTIKSVVLTKQLESQGITISTISFTDEEEITELSGREVELLKKNSSIKNLIQKSLNAWEERDRYVETLRDDYVISYFWIQYNNVNRVFNPTIRLKELLGKFGQ